MNSHRHSTPSAPPRCPRCGYDLRGFVDTWSDSCPLTGRCSECGLDFHWRVIFADAAHPWLFEYRWRWRNNPIHSALKTVWTALHPRRFWTEVTMAVPIRTFPALCLVALSVITAVLVVASFCAMSDLLGQYRLPSFAPWPKFTLAFGLDQFTRFLLENLSFFSKEVALYSGWYVLASAMFFFVPTSLRIRRVLPEHPVRIALYGLPLVCLWVLGAFALRNSIDTWTGPLSPSGFIVVSWSHRWPRLFAIIPVLAGAFAMWYWLERSVRLYLQLPDSRLVATMFVLTPAVAIFVTLSLIFAFTNWPDWISLWYCWH